MSVNVLNSPDKGFIGLEVLNGGALTTVQDMGRPGLGDLGVGASGAADMKSMRLANRLVGNHEHAAVLEIAVGGLVMRAVANLSIAVTGATCPLTIAGRPETINTRICLRKGEVIQLGMAEAGFRAYLAVRGGIEAQDVLGSKSTDMMAQLGPDIIRDDDQVRIGTNSLEFPCIDFAPVRAVLDQDVTLDIVFGPRDDWFISEAHERLVSQQYVVTAQSDRIGMRLEGPELLRARSDELHTEGTVAGSLQVPPSGQPTLFLADHPVTGGYPVIAVVVSDDLHLAAQLKPGSRLRFKESGDFKRIIEPALTV